LNDDIRVIAIDAPIIDKPKMRSVDRLMIKRGFRVLPPNFSWMKLLSTRAFRLYNELSRVGVRVIETHPRSSLLSSRCIDISELLRSLEIHTSSSISLRNLSKDLVDALICACAAYAYVKNLALAIKDVDGCIYLVKPICNQNSWFSI